MTAARLAACTALALAATTGAAQETAPASRYELALAAGYKAQFVCSATFNAGKALEAIRADELTGIYPEVEPRLYEVGEPKVDREEKRVTVAYGGDMPPRVAVWREGLGCTALPAGSPQGAELSALGSSMRPAEGPISAEPWPVGTGGTAESAKALASPTAAALAGDYGGKTSAVVVTQNGKLVQEAYAPGFSARTSQRTWSVAKSIAVTLIGAAAHPRNAAAGEYAFDPKLANELPQLSAPNDPRRAITVDQLLRMASGLDTAGPGSRTDAIYFGAGAVNQHATKHALNHAPGTVFNYANNDTLLAMLALRESMQSAGLDYHRFVRETLDKIGMRNTVPETDWQGNFILSSQVWSTARDLARLGQLYLQDGVWRGERILAEGWVAYATAPTGPQPRQRNPAATCQRGYGAQFWLYRGCDLPAGSFAAVGNRGQFVVIVPARQIVIVRRGYDTSGDRFDETAFARDVLDALGT